MANISTIKVGSTSYGITATPTAHASTATTYGIGTASNYGHVKLSDNYTSSAGAAASGIGASSAALYNAYNTLNSNLEAHMESLPSSCGCCVVTTNEKQRVKAVFFTDRGTALILVKGNTSETTLKTRFGVYYFVYDRVEYVLEKIAGDLTIVVDNYTYGDSMTVEFSGDIFNWATFDVISHKLLSLQSIV